MNNLTYTQNGDCLLPNLTIPESDLLPLGKYGRMRKNYLKEHRPILFNLFLLSGKLSAHLQEIDQTANRRLESFMAAQAKSQNLTEQTKAADPLAWVAQMNTLKAQAEEIILAELVYA